MSKRFAIWTTGILVLAMTAAGAWAVGRVPGGSLIAVHFGLNGEPNGWAPAAVALFLIPAVAAIKWAVLAVVPKITPRGANLDRSLAAYGTIWIAITVVLALAQGLIIATAFGYRIPMGAIIPAMVGCLFTVIGNVLPKLRWNYVVGIRTPWTLADERVWDKTHRFGGRVMVLGGAIMLLAALIPPYTPKPGLVAGVTGIVILLTIGKSYLLWRGQEGTLP